MLSFCLFNLPALGLFIEPDDGRCELIIVLPPCEAQAPDCYSMRGEYVRIDGTVYHVMQGDET